MTKLSITMAATYLLISLAPAANAYPTAPEEGTLQDISQVAFNAFDTADADGTCQINVTPELASILGLPDDWRTGDDAALTAVACNGDN